MGIQALKNKAYQLAGVGDTQQLKAAYPTIGKLNLRLKSAWKQAIAFLETHPNATPVKTMAELKAEVYTLAQVSTTQQLKTRYESLSTLNFNFKSSWEVALTVLKSDQTEFQAWLANPPEEYQALFAEIDSASDAFDEKLNKAKTMSKDAQDMAESLEQLAQEAKAEASQIKQEVEAAYRIAQQAELN